MRKPYISAGDLNEYELRRWLSMQAQSAARLNCDDYLSLEGLRLKLIEKINPMSFKVRAELDFLTHPEVHRSETLTNQNQADISQLSELLDELISLKNSIHRVQLLVLKCGKQSQLEGLYRSDEGYASTLATGLTSHRLASSFSGRVRDEWDLTREEAQSALNAFFSATQPTNKA